MNIELSNESVINLLKLRLINHGTDVKITRGQIAITHTIECVPCTTLYGYLDINGVDIKVTITEAPAAKETQIIFQINETCKGIYTDGKWDFFESGFKNFLEAILNTCPNETLGVEL